MSEIGAPLELVSIRKAYGSLEVLREVSCVFPPGRLGALVGPNGAGKTTLLRIAAGLQFAEAGTVHAQEVLYYGGFDTLPVRGTVNRFRRALGLPAAPGGRRPLRSLSRGQLHTVGLDVAIALRRHTILLDEPWTALEPDARETLNETLMTLAREGHVIVCSTHDLDEVARIADDVVLLKNGAIIQRRREEEPDGQFDRESIFALYRSSL